MKKLFLALVLFAGLSFAHAQDTITSTAIDEYVSATFPEDVFLLDTVLNGTPLKQHFSTSGNATFLLQRIKFNPADYGF